MANKNFVVHNGLSVGALTVDAATSELTTSGNITLTGAATITQAGVTIASLNDVTALSIALGG